MGGTIGGIAGGLAGGAANSFSQAAGLGQGSMQSPVSPQYVNDVNAQQQATFAQQQAFTNALMGVNGIQNQQNVFNQLQNVANGQGPNPAQDMLNQATGANVANQAALMASARGVGNNPALIARQAAMQGANAQQQAAGQGATMQANQSLGALNSLGGIAGNQVNQAQSGVNSMANNALGAQGNVLGAQTDTNKVNAQIGSANAGRTAQLVGNVMQGGSAALMAAAEGGMVPAQHMYAAGGQVDCSGPSSSYAQALSGAAKKPMMMAVGGNVPPPAVTQVQAPRARQAAAPAQVEAAPAQAQMPMMMPAPQMPAQAPQAPAQSHGGLGHMLSSMFGMGQPAAAPQPYDSSAATAALYGAPGTRNPDGTMTSDAYATLMQSNIGNMQTPQAAEAAPQAPVAAMPMASPQGPTEQTSTVVQGPAMAPQPAFMPQGGPMPQAMPIMEAQGGKVPALVSPGERYLPPQEVKKVAKGEKSATKAGEKIPGKPKYPGNDYRNDVVPKKLEAGGIVIPNAVMQSADPAKEAAKFVSAVMAKNGHPMSKVSKKAKKGDD